LNPLGYGIEFIIEILENALTEHNDFRCNVEVAKCKKLLNKIADKWCGKYEERGGE